MTLFLSISFFLSSCSPKINIFFGGNNVVGDDNVVGDNNGDKSFQKGDSVIQNDESNNTPPNPDDSSIHQPELPIPPDNIPMGS